MVTRCVAAVLLLMMPPVHGLRLSAIPKSSLAENGAHSMVLSGDIPEAGIASPHMWLEKVLGQDCKKYAELKTQPAARALDRTQFQAVALPPQVLPGLEKTHESVPCAKRQKACDAAKVKLTKAKCVDAAGFNGNGREDLNYFGSEQVCLFENLYSSGRSNQKDKVFGDTFLVAHTVPSLDPEFPEDRVNRIRHRSRDSHVGTNQTTPIYVQRHETLEAFVDYLEAFALIRGVEQKAHKGLSIAIGSSNHVNIGHALYDTMYPAFVSLIQLGLHKEPFHTVLLEPGQKGYLTNAMFYKDGQFEHEQEHEKREIEHEAIMGKIGGGSVLRTALLQGLHRFDKVVVGVGSNSAEYDINVNFTLGSARTMDGARLFRDRIYESFGLEAPARRSRSNDDREGDLPKALFVKGGGYEMTAEQEEKAKQLAMDKGVRLEVTEWRHDLHTMKGFKAAEAGVENFRKHLEQLSDADIHISGPGTTMMYQQLLQDGSVVVNLGVNSDDCRHQSNFGDEYMAEGAPHLRAIYALRKVGEAFNDHVSQHAAELAAYGKKIIDDGFSIPTEPGSNLSPYAAVTKAYAHLSAGDCSAPVDPQMPLRGYIHEFSDEGGWYGTFEAAQFSRLGNNARLPEEKPQHMKLLEALRQNFDDWAQKAWFEGDECTSA